MTSNWQQEAQRVVEQGKQATAGIVSGGEMLIDAEPEQGFFRVKLRNIQPPEATPQITNVFCLVLANGGAMFHLQVKQHMRRHEEVGNV